MSDSASPVLSAVQRQFDLPTRDGLSEKCKLDLFLPESPNGAAVFFVHGGGWRGGARRQWHPVMDYFCERGYVCASAGYRLLDEAVFPAQFEDVRTAYAVFKARAASYGFEPQRIASFGSSSGGHLASLLATTDPDDAFGYTADAPLRETRPAATVALCTVFSCHQVGGHYRPALFGGVEEAVSPELYTAASPIDRVSGREGPFAIIVGDVDKTTPLATQQAMCDRLRAHDVRGDLHVLAGVGHGYGYGRESEAQQKMLAIAESFLAEELR